MTADRLDPDTLARLRRDAEFAEPGTWTNIVRADLLALLDGYAPDAAADPLGYVDALHTTGRRLLVERDAALARIAAALALHRPGVPDREGVAFCKECFDTHPCATRRALTTGDDPQPEAVPDGCV